MNVIQRLSPFIARWGYLAIFVATFLENMGIPVPGEIFILIAGTFALHGKIFLPFVILVGAAGAVLGDSVIFFIGRFGGRKAIAKLRDWLSIDRRTLEKIDSFYHRRGPYAVTFGRFITGGRFTVAITSGASGTMSWERYVFYDYLGALIWAGAFGIAGFYFANQISQVLNVLTRSSVLLGIILLLLTIGYAVITYILRRYRRKAKR
ncbi:MAG: DedA family protein [Actinobacteria bacterium]|nr:DedA family protein [Actinomycetota bacterium]